MCVCRPPGGAQQRAGGGPVLSDFALSQLPGHPPLFCSPSFGTKLVRTRSRTYSPYLNSSRCLRLPQPMSWVRARSSAPQTPDKRGGVGEAWSTRSNLTPSCANDWAKAKEPWWRGMIWEPTKLCPSQGHEGTAFCDGREAAGRGLCRPVGTPHSDTNPRAFLARRHSALSPAPRSTAGGLG